MTTRAAAARLLALALPLALLVPGAAHAETVVTEDAAGDAQGFGADLAFVPAPQEATVDIARIVASLGHRRLSVTVHFRDLQARARHTTSVRVRTPRATFDLSAARDSASRPKASLAARGGGAVRCPGLRSTYDGGADEVTLSVPAACIGSPRWVRLGVGAEATPEANPQSPSWFIYFADDGHRDTYDEDRLAPGPRIHRG